MAHRCYISFKMEDKRYKEAIQKFENLDMIDKSLNERIDSSDEDYVMREIRAKYLSDSTVTIFLIGTKSSEILGEEEQFYIKKELQASLYNGKANSRNGILGIVLPTMSNTVFGDPYICSTCGESHNLVRINDSTVIREFSRNFYIPNNRCSHREDERYCVLAKWEDFSADPNTFVDLAFDKRSAEIATKVRVYP